MTLRSIATLFFCTLSTWLFSTVEVGLERIFSPPYSQLLANKRIALLTNHTAVDHQLHSSIQLFKENSKNNYKLVALYGPEHGIYGFGYAEEKIKDGCDEDGIPIYSLHGHTRRPTDAMLKGIDLIVYDIQDIGSRSYTYISTLFYTMEEAAKKNIRVVVLDRPNPINGVVVDGPLLDEECRSFVSYLSVPYCHGMTVGELALFFNKEYGINCDLTVVPMKGWKRTMTFHDTGLPWVPTSPHIPEPDTVLYYPATGILGELQIVNIGIGYTLPFKCVGAPWITGKTFAEKLNEQQFPGVRFLPFHFRPFFGRFAKQNCEGVLLVVTNPLTFQPVSTQYLIIGMLKSLYPKEFAKALASSIKRKEMFNKVNGTKKVYQILTQEKYVVWKLRALHEKRREIFQTKRKPYLIYTH